MSLQLVNQTVRKTYKEDNVEGFSLNYDFEREGDKIKTLNCSATKVAQAPPANPVPGETQYYGSYFFNHTSGGALVNSVTRNHYDLNVGLENHVKAAFEQILAE